MKIVRTYSYKCANSLTKHLNENNEKRRIYYYSFQIILGGFVKAALLVAVALLTGCLIETFTVVAFYAGFRTVGGGYHMDDYTNCMLTSIAMFIASALIAKYTSPSWSMVSLMVISAITFAVVLFAAFKYAPADTSFKPMNNPKQNKKLKNLSIIEVFIWQAINIFFIIRNWKMPVLAGCLAMLMAAFIISPAGYRFFDYVNEGMKKLGKRTFCKE